MFIVQETETNKFAEITFGNSIVVGDVVHPWQITEVWTDTALEEIGVFRVSPAPPPVATATVKGYRFERVDGVVTQLLDIELPEGNTLKMSATARQIRLAMNVLGLRDAIETFVATQPIDVRDSWQFTTEFEISHPFILAAQAQMGKSDEELMGLFSLAQTFT